MLLKKIIILCLIIMVIVIIYWAVIDRDANRTMPWHREDGAQGLMTNNMLDLKRGSVAACHSAGVVPVIFEELWLNYPHSAPYTVNGKIPQGFSNQCAIYISKTLHQVGIKMTTFLPKNIKPEGGAPTIGRILLDGLATATRASELAQWLATDPVCGIGAKEVITGADWAKKIDNRTGIVFFGEYWSREGDSAATANGGHIDLWNGKRMKGGGGEWSYFRAQWHMDGRDYDLSQSKRIWFFEVKRNTKRESTYLFE